MRVVRARVEETIDRRRLLEGVRRVGVAVSGGADSTALLYLLAEICTDRGLELSAFHLNHGLRGEESDADEELVRRAAASLGLPFEVRAVDTERLAREHKWNLEDAGRRARYSFFEERIADGTVDAVATGHHKNDQAETVLFRILRGGGLTALGGIRASRTPGIIRPLIDTERAAIEQYLSERSIGWREDASNDEPRFSRNRIRKELLPSLERDWNPRLTDALARNAELAADEEGYWTAESARLAQEAAHWNGEAWLLEADRLAELHPAVERRVWRHVLGRLRGDLQGLDAGHVERLRRLASQSAGSGAVELPGVSAERSFGMIRLAARGGGETASAVQAPPLELPAELPTELAAPDGLSSIRLRRLSLQPEIESYTNRYCSGLAWDRIPGRVCLRAWRPGDRFRADAGESGRKVKDLFQRARVAAWDRAGWPVLAAAARDGEELVWMRGFGVAEGFSVQSGEPSVVSVEEFDGQGREISGIEDWQRNVSTKRGPRQASGVKGNLS